MDTLKYPLTFSRGRAVTVAEFSDAYKSQAVAIVVRTRVGEMPLEQTFGISDPSFSVFLKSEFLRCVNTFWPEIQIKDASLNSRGSASGNAKLNITLEG
jgi:hypothetical protein